MSLERDRGLLPNILLIVPHDLGWHDLGCFGNPVKPTPTIDRLAREGVQFENAFVTAPQCSPSRASILTGRYPHTTGMMGLSNKPDWFNLSLGEITLPQLLKKRGYRTSTFGVWHVDHSPDQRGFNTVRPDIGHFRFDRQGERERHREFLDHLASLIDKDDQQPFFTYICPSSTHRPYTRVDDPAYGPEHVWIPPHLPDNRLTRQDLSDYYTLIRWLDRGLEDILELLDKSGSAERTLLCFLSDHGAAFPRAKCTLYDTGIKTPLILRWPSGFGGGRTVSSLVSSVDLLPTFLEITGIPVPSNLQGTSLFPILSGKTHAVRGSVYSEKTWHIHYDPMRMIRTPRYKYIHNFEPRPLLVLPNDMKNSPTTKSLNESFLARRPIEELYDLQLDPWENKNLAQLPRMRDLKATLRDRLMQWLRETGDPVLNGPVEAPEAVRNFSIESGIPKIRDAHK